MPKQMTAEERAAYQRDYRARKKREQAEAGLIELRPATPKQEPQQIVAPPPWKSAEAFAARVEVPQRNVHEACLLAEAAAAERLRQSMALYDALLGTLESIVAATARQRDVRTFVLHEDLVLRAREVVDEANSLEAQVRRLNPSFDPESPF